MDLQLTDRVAIVTGASRGLGYAIAEAYAGEGMRVVAAARSAGDLAALAQKHGDLIHPAPCDVANLEQVARLAELAVQTFGRVDVVVNNAGVAPADNFLRMGVDTWHQVFAVNVFAAVALTQAAGRRFIDQGHGKVINVASTSGLRGKPSLAAYSASKGALLRFTEAVASEWAPRNVQVNAIAPGAFVTDAQQAVLESPELLSRRLRKIPTGRMGEPHEIGPLACYLASPLSNFVTGATYVIDGGEAAKL